MNKSRKYLAYSMLLIYSLSFVRASYESIHLIAHFSDILAGEFVIHHHDHQKGNHTHALISLISDDNPQDEGINTDEYSPKMLEYSTTEKAISANSKTLSLTIWTGIQLNYKQQTISSPTQPPDIT